MGQDLPRSGDDARRRRSPRPPRHHLRNERRKLSPPRRPRTQTQPRPAAGPRDGQDRNLIVAARQLKRSYLLRDNHAATIMPTPRRRVLILIVAVFPSRLPRDILSRLAETAPDLRHDERWQRLH